MYYLKIRKKSFLWCHYKFISGYETIIRCRRKKAFILLPARIVCEKNSLFSFFNIFFHIFKSRKKFFNGGGDIISIIILHLSNVCTLL